MKTSLRTITIIKHGHELTCVEVPERQRSNRIDIFGKSHTFETAQPQFNGLRNMALQKCRRLTNQERKELQQIQES